MTGVDADLATLREALMALGALEYNEARPSVAASPIAVQESPPGASFPGLGAYTPASGKANTGDAPGVSGAAVPANSPMRELARLMEEPAGGENHGRRVSDNPNVEGEYLPLETRRWQRAEFMRSSGWIVASPERDHHGVGLGARSHAENQYTVLHPEEYVDETVLASLLEAEFGFTIEELHSVYSTGGRIPSERLDLRARLDARLFELSNGGANMDLFGRAAGLNGSTVDRALARARSRKDGT